MRLRYGELEPVVITRASVFTVVFLIISTTTFVTAVYGEEFSEVMVNLTHSPDETPTEILNVGAAYNPDQQILSYETWSDDYESVGLDMLEGSYVGSFFTEGLLEFDYTPEQYDSWGGQHSFILVSKNFRFTYEQIMSGSTKWTVRLPVYADCILPQSFPPVLDNYNFTTDWNDTQEYMVDMLKGYPPKFAIWETTTVNSNVTFRKTADNSQIRFIDNEILRTTTPIQLSDGVGNFIEPDAICNVYVPPEAAYGSEYYYHLDEDNNVYLTDHYHSDDNISGFISSSRIINNRIYIEMNYPVKPETNYTMSFVCRLKDNPKVYFTEETIGGEHYTDIKIVEINEPRHYSNSTYVGIPRDFLFVFDAEDLVPGDSSSGWRLDFDYEEYNRSLPMDSGWNIIFEEGYGNGLFGVEKEIKPGDTLIFRPYVDETEDNESLKHLSLMLPFICDDTINPDIFVAYGNVADVWSYTNGIRNGKYRWFASDAAMLDYDYDGILNYLDGSTEYNRYGYNHTFGASDFYGENPYFYSRIDNIYDGYVDFDWNTNNNDDTYEYFVIVNNTKPYYVPVTAWNASTSIEILNTTETLLVNLSIYNEGSFYSNITVLNHEMIITVDKIGPLGTYLYEGPATNIIFWRGDGLNQSVSGGWDGTWANMGNEGSYTDEYGNSVTCRNCLWLNYTMEFWTTNPSDFNWTIYDPDPDPDEENYVPKPEGQVYIVKLGGYPKKYFFREIYGGVGLPESSSPLFVLDGDHLPIQSDYSKPYPWVHTIDPVDEIGWPGMSFNFPVDGYDYFSDYDELFLDAPSIRIYDSDGTTYEMGTDYEMHVLGNVWHYKHYFVLAFNVLNETGDYLIPIDKEIFVEIWVPDTYTVRPLFGLGSFWDDDWVVYPEDHTYYNVDPDKEYFSTIERAIQSTSYSRYTGTDRWDWSSFGPYNDQSYYDLDVSWLYPGVSATKMSDSDGINASDYILFSTRNYFLQAPTCRYPGVGTDPTQQTGDVYAEDGFVVYVIFREYTNLTFLCYDPEDTSIKNTNLTNKFYYVSGQDSEWMDTQGNQYLSEPVWRTTHVLNEWFAPSDESLWNDGLSLFIDWQDIPEGASSGEVTDLTKFDYSNTDSPLFWLWYPSSEVIYSAKYYEPKQMSWRESTEVYYFTLFNSATLTDGEWTQVLVEPEYVWTSVPRFDTRINIGNYFITVVVPQGNANIDALSGVTSEAILDIMLGIAGDTARFLKGMGNLLKSIGGAIWDGVQYLYDGASDLPGWIMGAFTGLIELVRNFGVWIYQLLLNFVGMLQNLAEELLDFIDFIFQFMLFILPFVAFMLVVNYYQMFMVKIRVATKNMKGRGRGEAEVLHDD